jgi:hypothetical protein
LGESSQKDLLPVSFSSKHRSDSRAEIGLAIRHAKWLFGVSPLGVAVNGLGFRRRVVRVRRSGGTTSSRKNTRYFDLRLCKKGIITFRQAGGTIYQAALTGQIGPAGVTAGDSGGEIRKKRRLECPDSCLPVFPIRFLLNTIRSF